MPAVIENAIPLKEYVLISSGDKIRNVSKL